MWMGENSCSAAKKQSQFPTPEIPPHQIEIPSTSFIYSCSHSCCFFFLTLGFMYRYIMQILISQWLLNLICSMKKALNGQNSSKQNSEPPSHRFYAIWKTLPQLLLVFLFTSFLFPFKLYKFFLIPLQL